MSAATEFARLVRLPPAEALDYLRGRGKITETYHWQDLWEAEHARQFTVSRLARLDILKALQERLIQSVDGDLSRRDWTRDVRALLKREGWWGEKEVTDPETGETVKTVFDAPRLKLIFDTNTRTAYAAGHWQQIEAAKVSHPYIRYITKRDERVRLIHQQWDNLVLPVEHPFWETRFPPNGWRCRCRTASVSEDEAARLGKAGRIRTKAPPEVWREHLNKRTGEITRHPLGVDPGFAWNPGRPEQRQASIQQLVGEKLSAAPAALGAAFGETDGEILGASFAAFFDAAFANRARPEGKLMVVGAMKPRWVEGATKAGVPPETAEIAVRDRDITHFFRDAKENQLPPEWLRDLPKHLKSPQAVLLDKTHEGEPALLLIYDAQAEAKKLVVRINYKVRKQGTMNIVETGRPLDVRGAASIRSQLGKGYELIDGDLRYGAGLERSIN